MPDSYFRHIKRSEINRHLRAVSALTVAGEQAALSASLTLLAENEVTSIHSDDRPGLLNEILDDLSKKSKASGRKPLQALRALQAFSAERRLSCDEHLRLWQAQERL